MSSVRIARTAFLFVVCTLLSGCFYVEEALLSSSEGAVFPGGPGAFKLIAKDGVPAGRLIVSQAPAATGNVYRLRSETQADGKTKTEEAELTLLKIDGDTYLAQMRDETEKRYLIAPARITDKQFLILGLAADNLSRLAERHGVKTMQELLFGDNSAIRRALDGKHEILVVGLTGPVLHVPKAKALAIAREMVLSADKVPLEDGNYVRE